ncbi:MAG TPA: indolepyruvate oxidoreductase subunit beta [Armatimonadota bacterium]|nr:indolepyruvate oxidoreductase subunit beta [Armatimonadota bacterium]
MAGTTSILIVGVGGQGIVLAGDVIGLAARLAGMEAKASEIHGMSQRGGSVVSEVRFGDEVFSPLIPPPGADFILGFELLEGLRALDRLRPGGLAIVNKQHITPVSVTYGSAVYPQDAEQEIRQACPDAIIFDALEKATELGNARAVNSVLMGVLASRCAIPVDCWHNAIRQIVKPRFVEMNLAAFESGYSLTSSTGARS